MRYELNDDKWTAIKPVLPNKPRGVHRVNDRRVLNSIFWVLRSTTDKRDFGTHRTSIAELLPSANTLPKSLNPSRR